MSLAVPQETAQLKAGKDDLDFLCRMPGPGSAFWGAAEMEGIIRPPCWLVLLERN